MIFTPHAYQKYAIDYIEQHPVAAVLLDMGLGKTVITLTALQDLLFDRFEAHRVLVIAPLRVARDTWPSEISKWDHLAGMTFAVAVGNAKEREAALENGADITVINRENVPWLIRSGLFDFDTVVIDELSSFKSAQSKRFKAMMRARRSVKRIIGLTGTPAGNSLMDLWAEFRILDMGQRLGSSLTRFRLDYFTPDKRNGAAVYSYKPLPGAEKKIYGKIADITISMKAIDHLGMPDLISSAIECRMDENEAERYADLKKNLALTLPDGAVTAANAASLTNKLCQMANGAVYGDDGEIIPIHDRKLDVLEDIIESMNGRPLLVAYWFRHDLGRIKQRFGAREIKNSADIADWNAGRIQVACIHPASAGHGLNLQSGGSAMVWFSLTWSLELYQQANARLWRQGQESRVVTVQHIITKGTIDEKIMAALERKNITQSSLINAVKACL